MTARTPAARSFGPAQPKKSQSGQRARKLLDEFRRVIVAGGLASGDQNLFRRADRKLSEYPLGANFVGSSCYNQLNSHRYQHVISPHAR